MLKKIIIPTLIALAFASHASALNVKGKFKTKAHKINGAWALLEIEGHQVISFHDNFKTQNSENLRLLLSKTSIRQLNKTSSIEDPINLGLIKSHTGDQHYIVPKTINIEDYKSVLIHSESENIIWGGFDIPRKRSRNYEERSSIFEDNDFEDESYGS